MILYKELFTPARGLATGLTLPTQDITELQLNTVLFSSIGQRILTPLVENFVTYENGKPVITDGNLQALTGVIYAWYNNKWGKLHTALIAEYNPTDNYKRQEVENIVLEGSENISNTENTANKVYAYDSENPTNDKSETITGTNANTENSEKDRNLLVTGKMGGTSTQSLIREELKLRENILLNLIFTDIKKLCVLPIY